MKFLIFNIAVVTALGFLFFGNPADIQQASNKVVRAVEGIKEKVFTVAENKTEEHAKVSLGSAKQILKNTPENPFKKVDDINKTKQDKVDALVNKVKEVLKTSPQKKTPLREVAPAITTKPNTPIREHKRKAIKVVQTENTTKVALKPKTIISRPKIDKIEPEKQTEAQKNNARIRELLADKPRVTPKLENRVSDGLMSPQDRRRELMVLADDMELVHAQSLEQ